MALQNKLKDPKVQIIAIAVVVVVILLLTIFASKKVVVDGNECYIMPLIGTIRCGIAHKVIFGILALVIIASVVSLLVKTRKKVVSY